MCLNGGNIKTGYMHACVENSELMHAVAHIYRCYTLENMEYGLESGNIYVFSLAKKM